MLTQRRIDIAFSTSSFSEKNYPSFSWYSFIDLSSSVTIWQYVPHPCQKIRCLEALKTCESILVISINKKFSFREKLCIYIYISSSFGEDHGLLECKTNFCNLWTCAAIQSQSLLTSSLLRFGYIYIGSGSWSLLKGKKRSFSTEIGLLMQNMDINHRAIVP